MEVSRKCRMAGTESGVLDNLYYDLQTALHLASISNHEGEHPRVVKAMEDLDMLMEEVDKALWAATQDENLEDDEELAEQAA